MGKVPNAVPVETPHTCNKKEGVTSWNDPRTPVSVLSVGSDSEVSGRRVNE